ncbi:unnamed protein product [Heligmosomoides polygyrus]|uniref:Allene-oxide cyclase n=1 Tax=Heligmosomoides polygyrus TaxID=6339 RepID=A0A183G8E4_HELPZ|nr:unnamed protein product [Heligmosomoides polygyrus]
MSMSCTATLSTSNVALSASLCYSASLCSKSNDVKMLARSFSLARGQAAAVHTSCAALCAAKPTGKKVKTFEIYRWDPDKPGMKPEMKVNFSYRVH